MDHVIVIAILLLIFLLAFVTASVLLEGRFGRVRLIIRVIILLLCLFVILYETILFRSRQDLMRFEVIPFWSYGKAFAGKTFYLKEILLNILLYIPFGFMMPAVFRKMKVWQMILVFLFFSCGIELIQLFGRIGVFETDDILDNTLGGILGLTVYRIFRREAG
jgi:glycopeptide antibiotics resistance protein